ncbi:hypothetical protein FIBSPDRAFT_1046304 [Athelia psychrophila]|uniref:RING-type E3 ubiquitin transferase n=1 Tax=Athelia psychrophila TaxID=1759441 RepID=A0A166GXS8_9AGAM|nr:hypothetical protein FIBSPDRAFT_1046304 [Fibularhizoctonia sp. CBS 109695]
MSTQTATQTARGNAKRGRGGTRARGNNRGRGGQNGPQATSRPDASTSVATAATAIVTDDKTKALSEAQANGVPADDADDAEVCWICAEPVKYYSVSDCDHRVCHICALRLRALYKKTDCTFCKTAQPTVIFTVSPDAAFLNYKPDDIPCKDSKLGIFFENEAMMEETLLLLRFNCPDSSCDYIGAGWGDLKLHVRGLHGKLLCEVCIRFKKVFSHEHALYAPNILPLHLPSMAHRSQKAIPKEQIEGGVHPLCQFCRECFFSDDELYSHMRERHEECFVCKRNEVRDQYFKDYQHLERHFTDAHFACTQTSCQARKFVVFNSLLDLKGHMVDEHGQEMNSRDKKDARRVQAEFEFDELGSGGGRHGRRGGGGGGGRGGGGGGGRDSPDAGPSRPNGNSRRNAFAGNLTVEGAGMNRTTPPGPSRRASPSPPPEDPVIAERYAAFIARLGSLAPHPTTAIPSVKASVRGFKASEASARDIISTVWTVLDQNLDDTASIINAVVDLMDEEDKKKDLLSSWNGFKIEQRRQFPDLVPTSVGSGYAGIANGRVLNAKNVTSTRSSRQSSGQLWDRVAQAAGPSSSSARAPVPAPRPPPSFPPLQPALAPAPVQTFRQNANRTTPWSASSSGGVRAPTTAPGPPLPTSVPGPGASLADTRKKGPGGQPRPPAPLSNSLFPGLPSSSSTRQKPAVRGNQSLKNIMGDNTPDASAWIPSAGGSSGSATPAPTPAQEDGVETAAEAIAPSKSKKKGKQKQTLFTLGSFPT